MSACDGYNLKLTDMQAAVGCAQLDKLDSFIKKRRSNFEFLKKQLQPVSEFLLLPESTPNSEPSWFGFLLTIRDGSPLKRNNPPC